MTEASRILIVDDEPHARFLLKVALRRLDTELVIRTAENGRQALDEVRAGAFDLIVTDLRMPVLDGITLTEAVRAVDPDTAIVWITALGCYRVRQARHRLKVHACLDKPLGIGQFRQTVLGVLVGDDAQAGAAV